MSTFRKHFDTVRPWISQTILLQLCALCTFGVALTVIVEMALRPDAGRWPALSVLAGASLALMICRFTSSDNSLSEFTQNWLPFLFCSTLVAVATHWLVSPVIIVAAYAFREIFLSKPESAQDPLPSETKPASEPPPEPKTEIEILESITPTESIPTIASPNITAASELDEEFSDDNADEIVEEQHDCSNESLLLALCQGDEDGEVDLELGHREDGLNAGSSDVQRRITYVACDSEIIVVAQIRHAFSITESSGVIHLPFFPALPCTPQVSHEQLEGPNVQVKVTEASRLGLRAELKLTDLMNEPTEVLIEFTTSKINEQTLSAAG